MSRRKIIGKIYYRITFRLASALSVGSGEERYSDNDIVRDAAGAPFIPGSTLAGIYRSLPGMAVAEEYLGGIRNGECGASSKVLVYDAKIRDADSRFPYRSVVRDCVSLDEWKTGTNGNKFTFETVEPGAQFVTYLEQNCEEGDRDICEELAAAWMDHRIRIGCKTMRGLGSIGETSVCRRFFALEEKAGLDAWLDFDMYREEDWRGTELADRDAGWKDVSKTMVLEMDLRQRSGISIKRYTTAVSTEKIQPDAEQITCIIAEDGREMPYIPGTSWAGAFRHHLERLVPGCTEDWFGSFERRSLVRFAESLIEGARPKTLLSHAVDRFTGGVVDHALFTEKIWYGGQTKLCIEIPAETSDDFKQALSAALTDLHMGCLPIGGRTAIGRGLFEGVSLRINGEEVAVGERMYGEILQRLKGR